MREVIVDSRATTGAPEVFTIERIPIVTELSGPANPDARNAAL